MKLFYDPMMEGHVTYVLPHSGQRQKVSCPRTASRGILGFLSRNRGSLAVMILSLFAATASPVSLAQTTQARNPRQAAGEGSQILTRKYGDHETISYHMYGINQGRKDTVRYEALASGEVKKDSAGIPYEDLHWTKVTVNGAPFPLSAASTGFDQLLSLSPAFTLSIPNLSVVQPILIGPIVDLLTFYADLQLASRQDQLARAGDRVYVKHGRPNSWADGTRVIIGEDVIDFDITLGAIDTIGQSASVIVRHVPPEKPAIRLPADWMRTPVGGSPNNWVQVAKTQNGKYIAAVGRETFTVIVSVDLITGAIISASMDNLVEVLERESTDATLSNPGNPVQYTISRRIELRKYSPGE